MISDLIYHPCIASTPSTIIMSSICQFNMKKKSKKLTPYEKIKRSAFDWKNGNNMFEEYQNFRDKPKDLPQLVDSTPFDLFELQAFLQFPSIETETVEQSDEIGWNNHLIEFISLISKPGFPFQQTIHTSDDIAEFQDQSQNFPTIQYLTNDQEYISNVKTLMTQGNNLFRESKIYEARNLFAQGINELKTNNSFDINHINYSLLPLILKGLIGLANIALYLGDLSEALSLTQQSRSLLHPHLHPHLHPSNNNNIHTTTINTNIEEEEEEEEDEIQDVERELKKLEFQLFLTRMSQEMNEMEMDFNVSRRICQEELMKLDQKYINIINNNKNKNNNLNENNNDEYEEDEEDIEKEQQQKKQERQQINILIEKLFWLSQLGSLSVHPWNTAVLSLDTPVLLQALEDSDYALSSIQHPLSLLKTIRETRRIRRKRRRSGNRKILEKEEEKEVVEEEKELERDEEDAFLRVLISRSYLLISQEEFPEAEGCLSLASSSSSSFSTTSFSSTSVQFPSQFQHLTTTTTSSNPPPPLHPPPHLPRMIHGEIEMAWGHLYLSLSLPQQSLIRFENAINIFNSIGLFSSHFLYAQCYESLGKISDFFGNYHLSIQYWRQVEEIYREIRDEIFHIHSYYPLNYCRLKMSQCLMLLGEVREAWRLLYWVLIVESEGEKVEMKEEMNQEVEVDVGGRKQERDTTTRSNRSNMGGGRLSSECSECFGVLCLSLGWFKAASDAFSRCLLSPRIQNSTHSFVRICLLLTESLRAQGETEKAFQFFEIAYLKATQTRTGSESGSRSGWMEGGVLRGNLLCLKAILLLQRNQNSDREKGMGRRGMDRPVSESRELLGEALRNLSESMMDGEDVQVCGRYTTVLYLVAECLRLEGNLEEAEKTINWAISLESELFGSIHFLSFRSQEFLQSLDLHFNEEENVIMNKKMSLNREQHQDQNQEEEFQQIFDSSWYLRLGLCQ